MPTSFAKKVENYCSNRFWNLADSFVDRRICGRSLVKYVPSISRNDREGLGGTGSHSTHYAMLEKIFEDVHFSPQDRFLDVGCGKGRVLAFLLQQKCPCEIHGVEYNEEVGKIASDWTKRYDQVKIIIGDAFRIDFNEYTVLGLARSFLPKTFLAFVELLEKTLTHPITLVSWYDQQSRHLLRDRPGWELQKYGTIDRIRGIKTASCPQGYSIWKYDPRKREAAADKPKEENVRRGVHA